MTQVRKLNIARRHLTQEQKRGLIRDQLKATPEQSDRQIAQALGVHHTTVATQRKELEGSGDVAKLATSIDTLGREQPRTRKPLISVFNPTKREERAMKKPEVVARMQEAKDITVQQAGRFLSVFSVWT